MFEDSLLESSGRLTSRRPWAAAASFAGQGVALGSLLLLSLIYTESLPSQRWVNMLQAPPPSAPVPAAQPHVAMSVAKGASIEDAIVVPREIPRTIATVHDDITPGITRTAKDGVVGSIPGVFNDAGMEMLRSTVPTTPKLMPSKARVSSGVAQGLLIRQVSPQYPQTAKLARIEGRVVLQATIGKDGAVQNLHLISGHPLLVQAAMDAVKQWLYKPYYLNGEAVEVDTTINVNFTLTQ